MRADVFLVQKGLAPSRRKAQELIQSGKVTADGKTVAKPSEELSENSEVLCESGCEFVGRGGYKLQAALDAFQIDVSGLIAADIGASTGGFCDCMLQKGVKKIYAVDVGHDQLAPSIKSDPRIVSMEGVNAKELDKNLFEDPIDFLTADLSFISVTILFDKFREVLKDDAGAVILIKPQFEAGKNNIKKNGIVKDPKIHVNVIKTVTESAQKSGFSIWGLMPSPITGGGGNREFLLYLNLKRSSSQLPDLEQAIKKTVETAHIGAKNPGAKTRRRGEEDHK